MATSYILNPYILLLELNKFPEEYYNEFGEYIWQEDDSLVSSNTLWSEVMSRVEYVSGSDNNYWKMNTSEQYV